MRDARGESAPPVRVLLPDGQSLVGSLHGWKRSAAGAWLGKVTLTVWQELPGGAVEAVEQQVALPSSHLRPQKGASYRAVPVLDAATTAPTGAAVANLGWPPPGDRWTVTGRGLVQGERTLHHADCWLHAGGTAVLNGDQARSVLTEPGVSPCDICGVERLESSDPRSPRPHGRDGPTQKTTA